MRKSPSNNYLNVLPKYRTFLCFAPRLPDFETCFTLPKREILHPRAKIAWSYLALRHGWLLSRLVWLESLKVLEPLQRREDDLSPPPPHGARVLGTSAACVLVQRSASSLRFLLQGSASPPHILIQGYKSKDFLRWECNAAPLHASRAADILECAQICSPWRIMARMSSTHRKRVTLRPGTRLKLGAMGEIETSDGSNQPAMMHSLARRKKVDSDGRERDECSGK
jgi:hypothetical protein